MNRVGHALLRFAVGWLALAGGGRASAWQPRAPEPLLFPVAEGGKLGFINAAGEVIIPLRFEAGQEWWHQDANEGFFEGRARVTVGGKHGFIDGEGRVVIAPEYERAEHFAEGLAGVRKEKDGPWQYLDRDGAVAIAGPFSYTDQFSGGVAFVREAGGERWGLIDRTGRFVVPPRFDSYGEFDAEGLARVNVNKRPELIDRQGRAADVPALPTMGGFHDGLAFAAVGGRMKYVSGHKDYDEQDRALRYGYVDRAGTFRIPARFDNAWDFRGGLAIVQINGRHGYIDTTGREVTPLEWDNTFGFSEGLAPVERNGLWGFVDRAGKVVIEPRFDEARSFAGGLAMVTAGDEMGYLDRTGREVWGLREFAAWGAVREIHYARFPGHLDGSPRDRLVFRRDGTAEYLAETSYPEKRPPRHRPGFGNWRGRVGTDGFRQLARMLHAEKFFGLETFYSMGIDAPTATTAAVRDGDAEPRVVRHGVGGGPLPLWSIDRAIEAVAADIVWTKAPPEPGAPEHGKSPRKRPHRGR